MNEAFAAQIETVLRTKGGSPSAKVYIKHNYGLIAGQINQLFEEHTLDAVQLVIICDRIDLERVKTMEVFWGEASPQKLP